MQPVYTLYNLLLLSTTYTLFSLAKYIDLMQLKLLSSNITVNAVSALIDQQIRFKTTISLYVTMYA